MWLLVGAGLLVAVLAGFLEYAHLARHRFLKDLPGKLGAEISREANGYTYSQSNGQRTLYTIHAAKFIQRKNNVVTLRDVGVVLYDTAGHADRIFGKEFEYDQKAGVMRAAGEVSLDLAAPAPGNARERAAYAAGAPTAKAEETEEESAADPQAVHVRTRGVEFRQKEGVATTDQKVEFHYGAVEGSAVGADFRSDTGVTVLRSQVELRAVRNGKPLHVTASHAELDRQRQEVRLERAEATGAGLGGEQNLASADRATVLLRTPELPEEVLVVGSVMLRGRGATVRAARGELLMGEGDKPRSGELAGGVQYSAEKAARHVEGAADAVHVGFAAGGVLERVRLAGGASAREREAAGDRTLVATGMDLLFAPVAGGRAADRRVWLRQATATGNARLVAHQATAAASGGRVRTDELAGDTLMAHLRQAGLREEVLSVEGTGHTAIHREGRDGAALASSGDRLTAAFAAAGVHGQGQTIETAEQVGHVQVEQRTAADAGKPSSLSRGSADRARYGATTDSVTLDGGVQLRQEAGLLWADEVVMKQGNGDVAANGRVRASYRAAGASGEPVEVQAERAEMQHEAGVATFFGVQGRPARMWQGGSSVEAAVIELEQKAQTLRAHGAAGMSEAGAVRTVLAVTSQQKVDAPMKAGKGGQPQQVTRIVSQALVYTDLTRQALFTGGVQVVEGTLRLRGEVATVFLLPAKRDSSAAGVRTSPFPGSGSLDRIVTTGSVHVDETGRQATGDRLVYTAADRVSVLTGSTDKPPVVTDTENGTLSGAEIRFTPGDNGTSTVVVSGGGTSRPKVRKDTRAR